MRGAVQPLRFTGGTAIAPLPVPTALSVNGCVFNVLGDLQVAGDRNKISRQLPITLKAQGVASLRMNHTVIANPNPIKFTSLQSARSSEKDASFPQASLLEITATIVAAKQLPCQREAESINAQRVARSSKYWARARLSNELSPHLEHAAKAHL